jgi:hypothetical protein
MLHKLSPSIKDLVIGAGMALDPCPRSCGRTHHESDYTAILEDWLAVHGDVLSALTTSDMTKILEQKQTHGQTRNKPAKGREFV